MEKRVFLAIFLCFVVLAVYQSVFVPPVPPPAAPAVVETPAPAGLAPSESPAAAPGSPTGAPPAPPVAPAATVLVGDAQSREIVVETPDVVAVFDTKGAALTRWALRHYPDEKGQPLDLVPQDLPEGRFARPFSVVTGQPAIDATLDTALFKPSAEALSLGRDAGTLTFEYRDATGLSARKTFYFQPDGQSYVLNVETAIEMNGVPQPFTLHFGPAVGPGSTSTSAFAAWMAVRALVHANGDVERLAPDDVGAQPRREGTIRFAGVDEHYFLAAAIPPAADRAVVEYAPLSLPVPGDTTGLTRSLIAFSISPNPGVAPSQAVSVRFFLGPKDFDSLRNADAQLVRAIDFGMFAFLVVPLLQALKWIHGFLGNYGWAIVVLTVIINILLFPLRHRSMVSMKKMQALQPEVKAIQERYAKYKVTDPERQKMNSEMMGLYKQKGVNPVSGCLPMLMTMPILLAFYNLLSVAIELRGAPFVGWIHDLAAKDPYYVWPVLMGATMFWQQKMMPTTVDPMQRKIFLAMPLIFTVMFLSMPSGLVIYWLVSNVLTIGQQYLTNRITDGGRPPVRAAVAKGKA